MAKHKVEIVIDLEDNASGPLGKVTSGFKALGGLALGGLSMAGGALTAVGGAALKLASDAAAIPGVTAAFDALTSSLEGGSGKMLAALKESSGGLISNTDLMKSYNQAAQLVSREFAEQLPEAMVYLSRVSASTGESMDFMLDSIVKGVGRLSPMILDNLGIQVNLVEANEAYAASIGKSVDELTKSEQQTALMNQVMEKLAANTAGMAGMSDPFTKLRVWITNLKDEVGARLIPAFTPLIDKLMEIGERVMPVVMDAFKNVAGFAARVATAIAGFVDRVSSGVPVIDALILALRGLIPREMLGQLMQFRNEVLPGLIDKFNRFREAIIALATPILEAIAQFVSWKDVLIGAAIGIGIVLLPIIWSIVSAIAAIAIPIAAAIAVVALLRNAWENNWGGIQDKVSAVIEFIKPLIQNALQAIQQWWAENGDAVIAGVKQTWDIITQIISAVTDTISTVVSGFLAAIRQWWAENGDAIIVKAQEVWQAVQLGFQMISAFITDTLIPTLQALYQKWVIEVWPTIQTVTQNVWTVVSGVFTEMGRWINDNIIPWIQFLAQKWDEEWSNTRAAIDEFWRFVEPLWIRLNEWLEVNIPLALAALKRAFDFEMKAIMSYIQPVITMWDTLVTAVKGFWDWISGKVFEFNFKIPDLPQWAKPGSPLPIHTAWAAFGDDMDKIGRQLAGGFDMGLGKVATVGGAAIPAPVTAAPVTNSMTINIDARGASTGVADEIERRVDEVMKRYGVWTDARIRTGGW